MINSPIYRFNSINETGINEVPNNGYLIIDNNGTIEHYIKLANTNVTPDSTIQDFLNNPNLFKKVDKDIGLESVGDGIRFSNGDYTKSVETGEKSLDLVQNINPLVDEIGVSGNHSVGFGVDNLVTGRNCIVQGRSNIVKERNNAVFGNGNISTAYEGFISGSENVLGFGDIISDYDTDNKFFKVQTKTFYDKCKSLIEDDDTPNELKEVYVTVFDTSMDYNTANFLHIKTHITKVGDNDEDQIVYVEDIVIPEGYGVYQSVSNIILINLEGDFDGVNGAESAIIGHNNIQNNIYSVIFGSNNINLTENTGNDITLISGKENILDNSNSNVIGYKNSLKDSNDCYVLSNFNTLKNSNTSYIMGWYNSLEASNDTVVFGYKNSSLDSYNNYIMGGRNIFSDSRNVFLQGLNNHIENSHNNYIMGMDNNIRHNTEEIVIGERNTIEYSYGVTMGSGNISMLKGNYTLGKYNASVDTSVHYISKSDNDILIDSIYMGYINDNWDEDDDILLFQESSSYSSYGIVNLMKGKIDTIDLANEKIVLKELEVYKIDSFYRDVSDNKGIIINISKRNLNNYKPSIVTGRYNAGYSNGGFVIGNNNQVMNSVVDSFLIGCYLVTNDIYQTVLGRYNSISPKNFIIGSGTSDNRKNALEIDFNTDELFANTSLETLRESDNNVLTTKEYVLEKVQITRNDFDAEQDQTDFEIDGLYSYIEVLQNGLELRTNKYSISEDTDNNKTTISLNDGADENDWILIKSMK